jgi:hypothetical protein
VDPDDPVGAFGGGAEIDDRNRGRVAAEHDILAHDPVELPEEVVLDLGGLRRGLQDNIGGQEVVDRRRRGDPGEGRGAIVLGQAPPLDGASHRDIQSMPAALGELARRLEHRHLEARAGAHLHDARPHYAVPDDGDALDVLGPHDLLLSGKRVPSRPVRGAGTG